MKYKHTQIGHLIIFVLLAIIFIFIKFLSEIIYDTTIFYVYIFSLLLIASFTTLKVTIDEKYIQIKFGYGIFKKRFMLSEIASVKTVKNHWYYGWGIRIWFWPKMKIYNVSGFDAVELIMKNGKIIRIGTDEPKKLELAIKQATKK